MTAKTEDTLRVGDTPLLRYTIKDGDDDVDLQTALTYSMRFSAPSGGTSLTVGPVLASGETAVLEYQCLIATFDAAGQWQISVRVTFGGSLQYESTVDKITVEESLF